LLGGGGPTVLNRVVAFADGWIPGHQKDLDALGARIAELNILSEEAGRGRLPVTIMMGHTKFFDDYRRIGAERVIVEVPSGSLDTIREMLVPLAETARRYGDEK
jgi:hypothetical protein